VRGKEEDIYGKKGGRGGTSDKEDLAQKRRGGCIGWTKGGGRLTVEGGEVTPRWPARKAGGGKLLTIRGGEGKCRPSSRGEKRL